MNFLKIMVDSNYLDQFLAKMAKICVKYYILNGDNWSIVIGIIIKQFVFFCQLDLLSSYYVLILIYLQFFLDMKMEVIFSQLWLYIRIMY